MAANAGKWGAKIFATYVQGYVLEFIVCCLCSITSYAEVNMGCFS